MADLDSRANTVSAVAGASNPSRAGVLDNDTATEVAVTTGDGSRDGVVRLRASQSLLW